MAVRGEFQFIFHPDSSQLEVSTCSLNIPSGSGTREMLCAEGLPFVVAYCLFVTVISANETFSHLRYADVI